MQHSPIPQGWAESEGVEEVFETEAEVEEVVSTETEEAVERRARVRRWRAMARNCLWSRRDR